MCSGLFQAALSLAVVLYKGLRLTQALEAAVAAMASACVQKQQDAAQHQLPSLPVNLAFGHTPNGQGEHAAAYIRHASATMQHSLAAVSQ